MLRRLASVFVALAVIALVAGNTYAQEEKGKGKRGAMGEEAFKKLDTDKNGTLSLEEFLKSPRAEENKERAEGMFKRMDANSDGEVSFDEFKAAAEKMRDAQGGKKGGKRGGKKGGKGGGDAE
ncbi:MAG: EF-hand domain-containing protein [Planctomycetota bacterium]